MSKSKEMKKRVITWEYDWEYDDKFEIDLLKIRTDLLNFLEKNLENPKNIDHKKLVDLTRHFIFDKVKKEFEKDFKKKELTKPQDFLMFTIRIMDFCLDYGFMILETITNFKLLEKINDKNIEA